MRDFKELEYLYILCSNTSNAPPVSILAVFDVIIEDGLFFEIIIMAKHDRHKPVLPDYVKYMANDSLFWTKEIGEIFGYSKLHTKNGGVNNLVNNGFLPKPIKIKIGFDEGIRKKPRNGWTKLEVIEAINKYNKEFFGDK
jgi:hypothetical protein